MLQICSYGIHFTPPSFPETKRWLVRSPWCLCPSLKFFKQQTSVHKVLALKYFVVIDLGNTNVKWTWWPCESIVT